MNKNSKITILMEVLDNVSIILARTSHPGNIGSTARAMKTMGLKNLVLVSPNLIETPMTPNPTCFDPEYPERFKLPEEAYILASGAKDLLDSVKIFPNLDSALKETVLSYALTSRKRELTAPLQIPREIMPEVIKTAKDSKIAFVFGNETSGLSINEVMMCNRLVTINGNPDYFSLNLSQAVQIMTYELFSHLEQPINHLQEQREYATHEQVKGLVSHYESVMTTIDFFERRNKERLLRRIHKICDKAQLEREEIDILRGFLNQIEKKTKI